MASILHTSVRAIQFLFTLVFLLILSLLILHAYSPPSSAENPFPRAHSFDSRLHERFLARKFTYLLSRTIEIDRPIAQVFDAVTTPKLWVVCYPETLSVGGISNRPIKEGDFVLEKFLSGGFLFTMFRYDVEKVEKPTFVRFHGVFLMSNSFLETIFVDFAKQMGVTFEYTLKSVGENKTVWVRDLHFYSIRGDWIGHLYLKAFMWTVKYSQEKGASLFVDCTKRMLELGEPIE